MEFAALTAWLARVPGGGAAGLALVAGAGSGERGLAARGAAAVGDVLASVPWTAAVTPEGVMREGRLKSGPWN